MVFVGDLWAREFVLRAGVTTAGAEWDGSGSSDSSASRARGGGDEEGTRAFRRVDPRVGACDRAAFVRGDGKGRDGVRKVPRRGDADILDVFYGRVVCRDDATKIVRKVEILV